MTTFRFADLSNIQPSFVLFDAMPHTHAWVKNCEGRFICANQSFIEQFGLNSPEELVGKNDYDISPSSFASQHLKDDDTVLSGGLVTDRIELIYSPDEKTDWFLTSKWPIYNFSEEVVGSFGISRHLNKTEGASLPYRELNTPIDFIHENYQTTISIHSLATLCCISVSALERRFKKHLGKTPLQYINEVRLDHARELLLETDESICAIALEVGFNDQSHFTRSFVSRFSKTPTAMRKAFNNHI